MLRDFLVARRRGSILECGGGDTALVWVAKFSRVGMNGRVRPLRVPGKPELRRYRLRYWDATPYGDWTDVVTVTVGP